MIDTQSRLALLKLLDLSQILPDNGLSELSFVNLIDLEILYRLVLL